MSSRGLAIWGHRGSHGAGKPTENTLPAFALALTEGADGVELDVQLTADEVPVVFHDACLTRMTEGRDRRRVRNLRFETLAGVALRGGATTPALDAVLELCRGRVPVNIEIKDPAALPAVLRLLDRRGAADEVVLSSFDGGTLAAALARRPRIPRAWIMGTDTLRPDVRLREAFPFLALRRVGAVAWHAEGRLVRRPLVAALDAMGVVVRCWTINDAAEAARLAGCGVAAVLTDHPRRLRDALTR